MPSYAFNPAGRFGDRVADYIRYRPGYPTALVDLMVDCGYVRPGDAIADIGSGTGMLAERFLERGYVVFCVEPNEAMRQGAEDHLSAAPGFMSVSGSAESTGMADDSVSLVMAGQAFHWFDAPAAHREFQRILRPEGACALVWNARLLDSSPFALEYETLLVRQGTDYCDVRHQCITASSTHDLASFFAPFTMTYDVVGRVRQEFDFEALAGRLFSSSYMPNRNDPRASHILDELHDLFDRHHEHGYVCVEYDTKVYHGRLV